jgi:hypothetical protein
MKKIVIVLVFCAGSVFGQTTHIFIYDSNGNQTTGTINSGQVYFSDSQGNAAFGTIRDGNVFLNTTKGEITFGTIRNGNVFLTDKNGITTGTIRNGNIFLTNSDGSITTGRYDAAGNVLTNTSPSVQSSSSSSQPQPSQQAQTDSYQTGYAIGQALGGAIYQARLRHAINRACFDQHSEGWQLPNGNIIRCEDWMDAYPRDAKGRPTVTPAVESSINTICNANPHAWYTVGPGYRYSCKAWKQK